MSESVFLAESVKTRAQNNLKRVFAEMNICSECFKKQFAGDFYGYYHSIAHPGEIDHNFWHNTLDKGTVNAQHINRDDTNGHFIGHLEIDDKHLVFVMYHMEGTSKMTFHFPVPQLEDWTLMTGMYVGWRDETGLVSDKCIISRYPLSTQQVHSLIGESSLSAVPRVI